jgi:hypothetical protein
MPPFVVQIRVEAESETGVIQKVASDIDRLAGTTAQSNRRMGQEAERGARQAADAYNRARSSANLLGNALAGLGPVSNIASGALLSIGAGAGIATGAVTLLTGGATLLIQTFKEAEQKKRAFDDALRSGNVGFFAKEIEVLDQQIVKLNDQVDEARRRIAALKASGVTLDMFAEGVLAARKKELGDADAERAALVTRQQEILAEKTRSATLALEFEAAAIGANAKEQQELAHELRVATALQGALGNATQKAKDEFIAWSEAVRDKRIGEAIKKQSDEQAEALKRSRAALQNQQASALREVLQFEQALRIQTIALRDGADAAMHAKIELQGLALAQKIGADAAQEATRQAHEQYNEFVRTREAIKELAIAGQRYEQQQREELELLEQRVRTEMELRQASANFELDKLRAAGASEAQILQRQLELFRTEEAILRQKAVISQAENQRQIELQRQIEIGQVQLARLRDTGIDVAGEVGRAVTDITTSVISGTLKWADVGRSVLASFVRVAMEQFTNFLRQMQQQAQTARLLSAAGASTVQNSGAGPSGGGFLDSIFSFLGNFGSAIFGGGGSGFDLSKPIGVDAGGWGFGNDFAPGGGSRGGGFLSNALSFVGNLFSGSGNGGGGILGDIVTSLFGGRNVAGNGGGGFLSGIFGGIGGGGFGSMGFLGTGFGGMPGNGMIGPLMQNGNFFSSGLGNLFGGASSSLLGAFTAGLGSLIVGGATGGFSKEKLGGTVGGTLGATIGTYFFPGIGTAIGYLFGSLLGSLFNQIPDPRAWVQSIIKIYYDSFATAFKALNQTTLLRFKDIGRGAAQNVVAEHTSILDGLSKQYVELLNTFPVAVHDSIVPFLDGANQILNQLLGNKKYSQGGSRSISRELDDLRNKEGPLAYFVGLRQSLGVGLGASFQQSGFNFWDIIGQQFFAAPWVNWKNIRNIGGLLPPEGAEQTNQFLDSMQKLIAFADGLSNLGPYLTSGSRSNLHEQIARVLGSPGAAFASETDRLLQTSQPFVQQAQQLRELFMSSMRDAFTTGIQEGLTAAERSRAYDGFLQNISDGLTGTITASMTEAFTRAYIEPAIAPWFTRIMESFQWQPGEDIWQNIARGQAELPNLQGWLAQVRPIFDAHAQVLKQITDAVESGFGIRSEQMERQLVAPLRDAFVAGIQDGLTAAQQSRVYDDFLQNLANGLNATIVDSMSDAFTQAYVEPAIEPLFKRISEAFQFQPGEDIWQVIQGQANIPELGARLAQLRPLFEAHAAALKQFRDAIEVGLGIRSEEIERQLILPLRDAFATGIQAGLTDAERSRVFDGFLQNLANGLNATIVGSMSEAFTQAYVEPAIEPLFKRISEAFQFDPGEDIWQVIQQGQASIPELQARLAQLRPLFDAHAEMLNRVREAIEGGLGIRSPEIEQALVPSIRNAFAAGITDGLTAAEQARVFDGFLGTLGDAVTSTMIDSVTEAFITKQIEPAIEPIFKRIMDNFGAIGEGGLTAEEALNRSRGDLDALGGQLEALRPIFDAMAEVLRDIRGEIRSGLKIREDVAGGGRRLELTVNLNEKGEIDPFTLARVLNEALAGQLPPQ